MHHSVKVLLVIIEFKTSAEHLFQLLMQRHRHAIKSEAVILCNITRDLWL